MYSDCPCYFYVKICMQYSMGHRVLTLGKSSGKCYNVEEYVAGRSMDIGYEAKMAFGSNDSSGAGITWRVWRRY